MLVNCEDRAFTKVDVTDHSIYDILRTNVQRKINKHLRQWLRILSSCTLFKKWQIIASSVCIDRRVKSGQVKAYHYPLGFKG